MTKTISIRGEKPQQCQDDVGKIRNWKLKVVNNSPPACYQIFSCQRNPFNLGSNYLFHDEFEVEFNVGYQHVYTFASYICLHDIAR